MGRHEGYVIFLVLLAKLWGYKQRYPPHPFTLRKMFVFLSLLRSSFPPHWNHTSFGHKKYE